MIYVEVMAYKAPQFAQGLKSRLNAKSRIAKNGDLFAGFSISDVVP